MKPSFIFSSNSLRLSGKDWVAVVVILTGVFCLVPRVGQKLERFDPVLDYRLPYSLSNDYWMFSRWSRWVSSQGRVLVLGDSVIWGHYVTPEQTLSHFLNERTGEHFYANLGVDGIHPAALLGLVNYYGRGMAHQGVILHLNPLWMSSLKHDLRGQEEFRFNHSQLVPQFLPRLACYRPSLAQRMGVLAERNLLFLRWVKHLRNVYFENLDLPNWTLRNPYKNPLTAITWDLPAPENEPQSNPVSWTERGLEKQDFPWVQVAESYQWACFLKTITALTQRGNQVFVIIGPFNPYPLTAGSLRRYRAMRAEMEQGLARQGIGYCSLADLPSEDYADASHPLEKGYAKMAEELGQAESFAQWLKGLKGKSFASNAGF